MRAGALIAASLFFAPLAWAQTASPQTAAAQKTADTRKWSVYWGWNRSNYSNSDIHFWGKDHDFTLKNVAADDLQTDATMANVFAIYLRPSEITIPQTNLRVAYQWDADTAIAEIQKRRARESGAGGKGSVRSASSPRKRG